jgi:hypothetical protein
MLLSNFTFIVVASFHRSSKGVLLNFSGSVICLGFSLDPSSYIARDTVARDWPGLCLNNCSKFFVLNGNVYSLYSALASFIPAAIHFLSLPFELSVVSSFWTLMGDRISDKTYLFLDWLPLHKIARRLVVLAAFCTSVIFFRL